MWGLDVHVSVRAGHPGTTPLLLLMGIGGNTGMWEPLRGLLGRDRTTIAFDVPGTGRSSPTAVPLPLPVVGRIATRVLDHVSVGRADLLGVSWGGLLAQQVALVSRARVRRSVLANTNFGVTSIPPTPSALRTLLSGRRYRDPASFAEALVQLGGGTATDDLRAHVEARFAHPPTRRGYLYQALASVTWTSLHALPLLRTPTLLLAGEHDQAIPLANARIMRRLIPGAELTVVPGGGHLMLFERAADLAPVITGFLDRDG
ncbi:alpha/beta fold hydrolase [Pseudonocardia sp. C8]|uniref:alpha/beta fold hydrolase n=1 Tax=Pseudonocardia sp. C8 TaxID=2762759 RepID=UPI0016436A8F|nr:alpha/beta fold hydrolase [Pseudonocardia sp. C8]MBC3191757.1 alpha/beta fold hydrolase [Pseudonocardia sp. C8]